MIDLIKELRRETGVSLGECKKAIEEAGGDIEKAKEILRKRGQNLAGKRSGREAGEGIITSYIHPNKRVGVLLDIRCESDFVARSEDFINLSREICLQIAAMNPAFVSPEDIPKEVLIKEKDIYKEQFAKFGKPEEIVSKIVEGKLEDYKKNNCLLPQSWIKDDSKTIKGLIDEHIAKIGENILVQKFSRFEL